MPEFGQILPNLGKIHQIWPDFGQILATSGARLWLVLANFGPSFTNTELSPYFARPITARSSPASTSARVAQLGGKFSQHLQSLARIGQIRLNLVQVRPGAAQSGQELAKILVRCRGTMRQPCPNTSWGPLRETNGSVRDLRVNATVQVGPSSAEVWQVR